LKKKLQYFDDINALQNMLETVQQKYDEVMAENIALQAVNAYAQETEELRIYKQRYASFFIHTTQILARHFSDLAHYFLVEGGEKNGITIDMVAVYKNCLIGRVIEVYPWYSKVQLITDRLCKIAAMCTETLSVGIHEGTNQETTRLRYVSHLSHITVNDLVLSSGQGLIFPKGFGLGRVVSYKVDGLHTEVVVQPTINLHQICYCTIISKSNM
jgi:rod shape-determining protein MreC